LSETGQVQLISGHISNVLDEQHRAEIR